MAACSEQRSAIEVVNKQKKNSFLGTEVLQAKKYSTGSIVV
jgi:hypothetical protein